MGVSQVTPLVERRHAWGFLVYDPSDGQLSREQINIASGVGVVTAGTVLAQAGASTAAAAALGTNTGNPTFGTIAATAGAGAVFDLEMADATHFAVTLKGVEVGHGVLGTPFVGGGLSFTFTAGGTACVPGDSWVITVPTPVSYVVFDPTVPAHLTAKLAILGSEYKDATSAAQKAAALTAGPSKVNANELVWGANVTTTPQQTGALAQLYSQGIRSV